MITTYKPKYTGKVLNGKPLFDNLKAFKQKIKDLEGCKFEMTMDLFQENRSIEYNAYYWGVIIATLAEATGADPDNVHEGLKKKYLRQIIRVKKDTGERLILDSTTKLYNREFAHYCNLIRMGEADICYIPSPNEVDYL